MYPHIYRPVAQIKYYRAIHIIGCLRRMGYHSIPNHTLNTTLSGLAKPAQLRLLQLLKSQRTPYPKTKQRNAYWAR